MCMCCCAYDYDYNYYCYCFCCCYCYSVLIMPLDDFEVSFGMGLLSIFSLGLTGSMGKVDHATYEELETYLSAMFTIISN